MRPFFRRSGPFLSSALLVVTGLACLVTLGPAAPAQDVAPPVAFIRAPASVPLFAGGATLVPLDTSGSSGDQVLVTTGPANTAPVRVFDAGKKFLGYAVTAPDTYTFFVVVVRLKPDRSLPLVATGACGVLAYASDRPPAPNPSPGPGPAGTVPSSVKLTAVAVYRNGSTAKDDLAFINMLDANPGLAARLAPYCDWWAMDDQDPRLTAANIAQSLTPGLSPQLLLYAPADAARGTPATFYRLNGTVIVQGTVLKAAGAPLPLTADAIEAAFKKLRGVP